MLVSSRTPPERPSTVSAGSAALTGGARVDVCIVGGGLSELIAAYYLAREKRSVMVMHAGPMGGSHTGAELAHLATAIPQPYDELERVHGPENARLAAQSYTAAIDALEAIVRRERIGCEFERLDGYRFCGGADGSRQAEREAEAAQRAGASGVQACPAPLDGAPQPAVRYPGQVQFHPLKLLEGLARAIAREGGRIHSGVAPKGVEAGTPSVVVTAAGHRIEANHVVMPGPAAPALPPVQGIGLRVPRGSVTRAVYWSVSGPIRCARLRGSGSAELLLVAGEGTPEALADWAHRHFPSAGEIVQRFQGESPSATDQFAMTGLDAVEAASVYVSTASWGSAVTRAVVAGMSIRDFVVGARLPEIDAAVPAPHPVFEPN